MKKKNNQAPGYNHYIMCADEEQLYRHKIETELDGRPLVEPHPVQARLLGIILQQHHNDEGMLSSLHSLAHSAFYLLENSAPTYARMPHNPIATHAHNLMSLHDTLYQILACRALENS